METFLACLTKNANLKSKEKNISKTLLLNTFYEYLLSLSGKMVQMLSKAVLDKFILNRYRAHKGLLLNLTNIYSKSLQNKFDHWRNITIYSKERYPSDLNYEDAENNYYNYKLRKAHIISEPNRSSKSTINKRANSSSSKRFYTGNNTVTYSSNREQINNFNERQQLYKYYNQIKKENREREKQNQDDLMCTFTPRILRSKNNSTVNDYSYDAKPSSVFQKLYEDYNTRLLNQQYRADTYYNTIRGNFNSKSKSKPKTGKRKIDKEKIERLYRDYRDKINRKRELQHKSDIENGYTYQPEICRTTDKILERKRSKSGTHYNFY